MTQFPQIHLNGTGGPQLLAEYMAAMEAVQHAIDVVGAATCHGRDYYTISSEAASTAFAERAARLVALEKVRSELEAIALDLNRQIDDRAR
jgi:hypothetical protein